MRRTVASAAVALVLLAACGGDGVGGADPYDSVDALHAALGEGGVECTGLASTDDIVATESGECLVNGQEVNISIYAGQEERDGAIELVKTFGTSGSFVVGPNWIVSTPDQALAERVREAIGGDVESL